VKHVFYVPKNRVDPVSKQPQNEPLFSITKFLLTLHDERGSGIKTTKLKPLFSPNQIYVISPLQAHLKQA
jgi:hypothetical protein